MARNNFKIFSYLLITIFLTLGLSISFQSLLAAWTAPLANPSACLTGNPGCDAPVNVSSFSQTKGGPLRVNADNLAATGFTAYGNAIVTGNITAAGQNVCRQDGTYCPAVSNTDTVDNLHAASFLRKDTSDALGSGVRIAFNGGSITSGSAYGIANGAAYNNINSIAVDTLETDGGTGGGGTLELNYYGGNEVHIGPGGSKPLRASIFYDGSTGYYVDPASTSNVNAQISNSLSTGYLDFRYAGGNSGRGNDAYAIFQEGGAWSYPYPDLRIAYHTGIKLGANSSYNGIRFYNDYNMATETMSVGNGDNNVRVAYNLYVGSAGGWLTDLLNAKVNASGTGRAAWGLPDNYTNRPSITGDSNYWTGSQGWGANNLNSEVPDWGSTFFDVWGNPPGQPSGTSHWQGIQAFHYWNGSTGYGSQLLFGSPIMNGTMYMRSIWGGGWSGWVGVCMSNGVNCPAASTNADTVDGYHVSVAGNANTLPTRNGSGYLIPENWTQLNGYYGLYSPNNGAHFYPNNGSYGAWRVAGSRNSWYGLEFDTAAGQTSFMVGTTGQGWGSQMTGFHNNSYGWLWRFDHSTLAVGNVPIARIPDIGSASVNYANTAGTLSGVTFTGPHPYFHLGAWGVGRTASGAVLVNTAYRADYADSAGNADTVDGKHASEFWGGGMSIFSLTHAQTYTTSWGHNGDTIYGYLTVNKNGTWTISRKIWCGHSGIWWGAASANNVEELCGSGKLTSIDPYSDHCIRVWVHPNTHGYLGIFGDSTNLANVYVSQ